MRHRTKRYRAWDKQKLSWIHNTKKRAFDIIGETTVFGVLEQYSIENLDNIIISEYIGIKDKDGNDVFEGDAIRHFNGNENPIIIVTYEEQYAGYNISYELVECVISPDCIQVVGNIYETPELLHKDK
jgi:uncharacterized phage protein (TIGR01671 family)